MPTEPRLTSIEAFVLALVEASSRLTDTTDFRSVDEVGVLPVAHDDLAGAPQ